jgi:hypothetical protein
VGQRANLILLKGSEYQLFYSHWCANTLPRDLFWGPQHAADFIRIQRAVDDSGWLDEVWAEGGALLDFDRQRFLLFGGEDIRSDVPLRRVYLELLASVWKDWTVRWATEGIAELADYLGVPRTRVLTETNSDSTNCTLAPPEQRNWTDLVASVRFGDAIVRLFPLASDVASYLSCGPRLVENLQPSEGLDRFWLGEWTKEFPNGGFHLDLTARRLDFWTASDAPDLGNRVSRAWQGWGTTWHGDRYESQLEQTEGLLRLPIPDRQTLLDRLSQMLLREETKSPADTVRMLVEEERAKGKAVQVNAWALRDDRLELSRETRTAILTEALTATHRG